MSHLKIGGFIFGASGVGKGFACGNVLSEYHGVQVFVSGDWCRDHRPKLANGGYIVQDQDILNAARHHLITHASRRWHFDCPRSVGQAEKVLLMFEELGCEEVVTWHLDADESVCRQRIYDRAERQGRLDDLDLVAVDKRMKFYYAPKIGLQDQLIPFLRNHTRLIRVNANLDLENMRDEVRYELAYQVFGAHAPTHLEVPALQ